MAPAIARRSRQRTSISRSTAAWDARWRARAIGHVHTLSKWGSRFAPVSTVVARSAAARWLGEALLGIDRRRTLPPWTRYTLVDQFARRTANPANVANPVILFNDT